MGKISGFFAAQSKFWLRLGLILLLLVWAALLFKTAVLPRIAHPAGQGAAALNTLAFLAEQNAQGGDIGWLDRVLPPPAYQWSSRIFQAGNWDITPLHAWLTQLPFILLALGFLYGIGRKLFGSFTGWLAPVFFLTLPPVLGLLPAYLPAWAAPGFLAAAVYFLLISDDFTKTWAAWAFGACFALSQAAGAGFLLWGVLLYYGVLLLSRYLQDTKRLLGFMGGSALYWGGWVYFFSAGEFLAPGPESLPWSLGLAYLAGLIYFAAAYRLFKSWEGKNLPVKENRRAWRNFFFSLLPAYFLSGWFFLNPGPAFWGGMERLFGPGISGGIFGLFAPWQLIVFAAGVGFLFKELPQRPALKPYLLLAVWTLGAVWAGKSSGQLLSLGLLLSPLAVYWIGTLKPGGKILAVLLLLLGLLSGAPPAGLKNFSPAAKALFAPLSPLRDSAPPKKNPPHFYLAQWGPLLGRAPLNKTVDQFATGMLPEMLERYNSLLEGKSGAVWFFSPGPLDPQLVASRVLPVSRPAFKNGQYLIYLGSKTEALERGGEIMSRLGAKNLNRFALNYLGNLELNPEMGLVLFRLKAVKGN